MGKISCISYNGKTLRSVDFCSVCPKQVAGKECIYCYVQAARKSGYHAKKVYDCVHYHGEIGRMRDATIQRLNACGGLRLFAFSDYFPWMDQDIELLCDDADARGLHLKAITKQPTFVYKWHSRMRVINVSVDNVGCGVDWDTAKELRKRYPNVLIRATIMREEDLEALDFVDILTFNHACNGFKLFSSDEKHSIARSSSKQVCCLTGRCEDCEVKCG